MIKPTENAIVETKSPKPVAPTPRPAPKAERYWFVFDRWLPSAAAAEDEFVLA